MSDREKHAAEERCRLVIILPEAVVKARDTDTLAAACSGGDVASVIVPRFDLGEADYQSFLTDCVAIGQAAGAAVLAVDDSQAAGRARADGLHITGTLEDLADAVAKADGRWIVGCGTVADRDAALRAGEIQPDYVFFGRIGKDVKPEPHKRNVELARWWAEMVELPCIVMGGSDLSQIDQTAATGADFVAYSHAIFSHDAGPAEAVKAINAALEPFVFAESA